MTQLLIGSVSLLAALFISILFYKRLEPTWLRLIPWFLIFNLLIQCFGLYYSKYTGRSNHFIFNFHIYIEYGFYLLIGYCSVQGPSFRRILLGLAALFTLTYVFRLFIHGNFFVYDSLTRTIGELLVLIGCFVYLGELLVSNYFVNVFALPQFWILTGVMIANFGDIIYFSLFDYIMKNNLDPGGKVYTIMAISLSLVEFLFFSIGLLCNQPWKKAS